MKYKKKYNHNKFKNTTKEERAKELGQIICPRCKYHNSRILVKKSGRCHLCGATLDIDYFKKHLKEVIKCQIKKEN